MATSRKVMCLYKKKYGGWLLQLPMLLTCLLYLVLVLDPELEARPDWAQQTIFSFQYRMQWVNVYAMIAIKANKQNQEF